MTLAAAGPSAYWYLTRATGVVALLLLTAAGAARRPRFEQAGAAPRWPRFVVSGLHRNVTLLGFLSSSCTCLTTVLDGYTPIGAARRRPPVRIELPACLARARRRRVRPSARTDRDQPPAGAGRPARVEARPLAGVRVVAGRARARVRHWQRREGGLVRPPRTRFGRDRRASRALACRRGARGVCGRPPRRRAGRARHPRRDRRLGDRRAARLRLGPPGRHACPPARGARVDDDVHRAGAATLVTGYAIPGATTGAVLDLLADPDGLVTVGLDASAAGGSRGMLHVTLRGVPLENGGIQMTASQVSFGPAARQAPIPAKSSRSRANGSSPRFRTRKDMPST